LKLIYVWNYLEISTLSSRLLSSISIQIHLVSRTTN